ncbi:MAG: hypothetical protein ACPGU1_22030 [Myxococcota bacterium]
MKRIGLCGVWVLSTLCLPAVATAQQKAAVTGTDAPAKGSTLSAEERIRRATVPPPGKACPPVPEDEARAALDLKHARNLAFVTVSNGMIEDALEVSESEWAKRRAVLDRDSRQDWEAWIKAKEGEGMTWTSLPPCPEPGQAEKPSKAGKHQRKFGRGITSLVGMVLGPRRGPPRPHSSCPPGDTECEAKRRSAGRETAGTATPECQPRETPGLEMYASVRGALVPGRTGANLLVASASNVPVSCSVDVSIRRGDAMVNQQTLQFSGPGSSGGIVQEVALGLEPDVYRDTLVLNSACVPRFNWERSRTSTAAQSR